MCRRLASDQGIRVDQLKNSDSLMTLVPDWTRDYFERGLVIFDPVANTGTYETHLLPELPPIRFPVLLSQHMNCSSRGSYVTGDATEQSRLARAVCSEDHPVLSRINLPLNII